MLDYAASEWHVTHLPKTGNCCMWIMNAAPEGHASLTLRHGAQSCCTAAQAVPTLTGGRSSWSASVWLRRAAWMSGSGQPAARNFSTAASSVSFHSLLPPAAYIWLASYSRFPHMTMQCAQGLCSSSGACPSCVPVKA